MALEVQQGLAADWADLLDLVVAQPAAASLELLEGIHLASALMSAHSSHSARFDARCSSISSSIAHGLEPAAPAQRVEPGERSSSSFDQSSGRVMGNV
jgi:hypothetical protein